MSSAFNYDLAGFSVSISRAVLWILSQQNVALRKGMVERYLGKAALEHFSNLLPNILKVLGSYMTVTKVSSI